MVTQVGTLHPVAQQAAQPDLLASVASFAIIIIVLGLVLLGIIIFVRWLFNKKENAKDLYAADYKRTIDLCKTQKDSKYIKSVMGLPHWIASSGVPIIIRRPAMDYSKAYWKPKPKKGETPDETKERNKRESLIEHDIRNMRPGENNKLGNYAGSCYTQDGCWNVLVKATNNKVMGLFPKLIVVKLRLPHTQRVIDPDERKKTKEIDLQPDTFSSGSDIIIIDALNIEKINHYYYPVNMDERGYIVDSRSYIYNDLIDISSQKQLIDVGRNMAAIAEDWVRSNPLVQMVRKTDAGLTSD